MSESSRDVAIVIGPTGSPLEGRRLIAEVRCDRFIGFAGACNGSPLNLTGHIFLAPD